MTTLSVAELVEAYGSPLYLYELNDVRAACAELQASLPQPSTLYYSLKANPHSIIARELHHTGCHAEISSTGELHAALKAGHTDFLYTGPGKTVDEISTAIRKGVRRFSVESFADYERIANAASTLQITVDCLLRLNTASSSGSSALRMTGAPTQFGIDSATLTEHFSSFEPRSTARIVGLHFFPISNARSIDSLLKEFKNSIRHAAHLREYLSFEVVDLGGGFATPYAQPGSRPEYRSLRPVLESELDRWLPGWRRGEPEIAFESGRYLTATAGQLACTVTDVKHTHGRRFIVLDSGINHLGGLAGLGRIMPNSVHIHPITNRGHNEHPTAIGGPLCTPADLLNRNTHTYDVVPGDIVTIPNVGAYGLTASLLAFLSRSTPVEVHLRDGHLVHATHLELRYTSIDETNAQPAHPTSPATTSPTAH